MIPAIAYRIHGDDVLVTLRQSWGTAFANVHPADLKRFAWAVLNDLDPEGVYDHDTARHVATKRGRKPPDAKAPPPPADPADTMVGILDEISRRWQVTVSDLKGSSRRRAYAYPRQEAMYLMVTANNGVQRRFTLPQIAKFLGGRDHSTVLAGARAYAKRHGLSDPSLGSSQLVRAA